MAPKEKDPDRDGLVVQGHLLDLLDSPQRLRDISLSKRQGRQGNEGPRLLPVITDSHRQVQRFEGVARAAVEIAECGQEDPQVQE